MVNYPDTTVTSKIGVNFVRTIVETAKCIFHKIEQKNDLGIDALIEFTQNGKPLNKQIAVQIKSGQSYYNHQSNQCIIPVESHYNYWSNYPSEVYGIVYIPSLQSANWINIKNHLKNSGECSTIKFDRTRTNIFDQVNFEKLFIPSILKKLPKFSFEEAKTLFHSGNHSENYLGMLVLFNQFPNCTEVWDWFIDYFKSNSMENIHTRLIYYFAHIPWHPDIWYTGEDITETTEKHVKKRFKEFSKQEVLKLLSFIDGENMLSRGSIGQSVYAIIDSLPSSDSILKEILEEKVAEIFVRECAILIFALRDSEAAKPYLSDLSKEGSWYAGELIKNIEQYGGIVL